MDYRTNLIDQFWSYQGTRFPDTEKFFDRTSVTPKRPPVFAAGHADLNVIVNPVDDPAQARAVVSMIESQERHVHFDSMASSQALAQSVFANLAVNGNFALLGCVKDDEGRPLLDERVLSTAQFRLEQPVTTLGESTPTSLDVCFRSEGYTVAFECKLTEVEVGRCSASQRKPGTPLLCDGAYRVRRDDPLPPRTNERCPLTVRPVKYWDYVPSIFTWRVDADMAVCPLNQNYQLVRNVLAVCVGSDGTVSPTNGHAVLIYDERNPAFTHGGVGDAAYRETKSALRPEYAQVLRRCSWQVLVGELRRDSQTAWLAAELKIKYGF
jgi:hypothetical protein